MPLDAPPQFVNPPAVLPNEQTANSTPLAPVSALPGKPALNAFGRTFPWGLDPDAPGTFGPSGLLGALLAGLAEGLLYVTLQPWFAHQDIHPQIAALLTVLLVAALTFFSKEAGFGRLVDRAFEGRATDGMSVRGAVAAAAVFASWIFRTEGFAQIYGVGEDISHPTAAILLLLPVSARLSEVVFLQLKQARKRISPATIVTALVWTGAVLAFLQPVFVVALLLTAVPLLLLGGSLHGEIRGRDLTGLGEAGFLLSLLAIAGLTMMY